MFTTINVFELFNIFLLIEMILMFLLYVVASCINYKELLSESDKIGIAGLIFIILFMVIVYLVFNSFLDSYIIAELTDKLLASARAQEELKQIKVLVEIPVEILKDKENSNLQTWASWYGSGILAGFLWIVLFLVSIDPAS